MWGSGLLIQPHFGDLLPFVEKSGNFMTIKLGYIILLTTLTGCVQVPKESSLSSITNSTLNTATSQLGTINSQSISWEITNRFRLIKGDDLQSEKKLFDYARLAERINCAVDSRACDQATSEAEKIIKSEEAKNEINAIASKGNVGFTEKPKTNYDSNRRSYDKAYIQEPTEWKIKLSSSLPDTSQCEWFINDIKAIGQGTCHEFFPEKPIKNGDVVSLKSGSENKIDRVTIDVKDLLVVGLGDSYASGEGMPDVPKKSLQRKSQWLDKKCHRSLLSAQSLTAARLAASNLHRSVTFVSRACSGAKIDEVHNLEQKHKTKEAQLSAIKTDLCLDKLKGGVCEGKIRQPDLVLLSIGGNDAHFAPMIKNTELWHITRGRNSNELDDRRLKMRDEGLKFIWERFPSLADTLLDPIKGFDKATIIHVNYPNPLFKNGAEGEICKDGRQPIWNFPGINMTQREYTALRDDLIMPLTGHVGKSPMDVEDYQLGLRQIDIAISCFVNSNSSQNKISEMTPKEIKSFALKANCEKYWKDGIGFNTFDTGRWRYSMARNEIKQPIIQSPSFKEKMIQLPGFVVNGICLDTTDVKGRWFNISSDTRESDGSFHGIFHPNIYGQLFLANRAWLAIPEEIRH